MTEPQDKEHISETTSLLAYMPSPNSTDSPVRRCYSNENLPLVSSYDDLGASVEIQMKELIEPLKPKSGRAIDVQANLLRRRHATIIMLLAFAVSAILVFHPYIHQKSQNPGESVPPDSDDHLVPSDDRFAPFSYKDPVRDLGLMEFIRPEASAPPKNLFPGKHSALPTNAWYQNLLLAHDEPSNLQRAYAVPYVFEVVGIIPGLRIHPAHHVLASASVMQLSFNELYSLTLGATGDLQRPKAKESYKYEIAEATELGVTLQWNVMKMTSSLVRGMPYATMIYEEKGALTKDGQNIFPTIAAPLSLGKAPIVDGKIELECSSKDPREFLVEEDIELYFDQSDFSWLIFFSEPVWLKCTLQEGTDHTYLQVVKYESDECGGPLVIRAAILDSCTTGKDPFGCQEGLGNRLPEEAHGEEYGKLLRKYANYYPGRNTSIDYKFIDDSNEAELIFHWDAQSMQESCNSLNQPLLRKSEEGTSDATLITFALPHHMDKFQFLALPEDTLYCKTSTNGPACLIEGTSWSMIESLPRIGFQAKRPPQPRFVPMLLETLAEDLNYTIPIFFQKGAGDTYFSGKMLAKLSRILLVADEVVKLCSGNDTNYDEVCKNSTLPTRKQLSTALNRLRSGVEIWVNGTAETPFVYDPAWGGVVSCGCNFNGEGCDNRAPECPAFFDQGLNFGNAFYNDQHFHYGYHIYSAAVVAHFDSHWGQKHFEEVLLLVRSIANPSRADTAFPLFRHKDWYQGSSWASGVPLPPYLNGKNQESSSEAIAAYESVALYGQTMSEIWELAGERDKATTSDRVRQVGQLMAATELTATKKYWHVMQQDESKRIYPSEYEANVVGILWSTMLQFGTWFGAAPYLPYGIQLLPLTPISEERDDLAWVNEMYYPFSKACAKDFQCTESGWVVLQLATLATVGYADEAAERVNQVPDESFENAGGNGQSRTNTIWYIATRKAVDNPVPIDTTDLRGSEEREPAPLFTLKDCHVPSTCTDEVLDRQAGNYTCRERISWVIDTLGKSQWNACATVAVVDYPWICGPCDPNQSNEPEKTVPVEENNVKTRGKNSDTRRFCPQCAQEICDSDLNRCPVYERTFICTEGDSTGGCSGDPWTEIDECAACCELTKCQKKMDIESKKITHDDNALERQRCPPCAPSVCYGELNLCPIHTAPYLCTEGRSVGGCSTKPWDVSEESFQCSECCEVTTTC